MADGTSSPDINPQTTPSAPEAQSRLDPEKSGNWGFLKNPITRRGFVVGGVATAIATAIAAAGAAAEKSLPKPTIDKTVNIDGNQMHFMAQEFNPKDGIKDPEEVVIFLSGFPMRANASVNWAGPELLAKECQVKTYDIDARPVGYYSGNAVDLEMKAILDFIKNASTGNPDHPKFKKVTIVAHSWAVPKAFKLAAEIYEKEKGLQVKGVAAVNPTGLYPESTRGMLKRYFADGLNQPNLQNPRAKHESLSRVGRNIVGSLASDVRDTGLGYPKLLSDQNELVSKISPDLGRVHAPVVLFLASEDKVSEKNRILPPEEIARYLPPTTPQGEQMRAILKRKDHKWDQLTEEERGIFGSKETFVKVQREQIAQIGYANDAYAKDRYLPNSQQLRVIVANKYASHLAFNERLDSTTHVISRVFDWMRRNPPEKRVGDKLKKAA